MRPLSCPHIDRIRITICSTMKCHIFTFPGQDICGVELDVGRELDIQPGGHIGHPHLIEHLALDTRVVMLPRDLLDYQCLVCLSFQLKIIEKPFVSNNLRIGLKRK